METDNLAIEKLFSELNQWPATNNCLFKWMVILVNLSVSSNQIHCKRLSICFVTCINLSQFVWPIFALWYCTGNEMLTQVESTDNGITETIECR